MPVQNGFCSRIEPLPTKKSAQKYCFFFKHTNFSAFFCNFFAHIRILLYFCTRYERNIYEKIGGYDN